MGGTFNMHGEDVKQAQTHTVQFVKTFVVLLRYLKELQ